ncbi:MAG TPA: hypothetical protein VFI39_05525 [Gemmatimonadales bacterium]|nr:hypothetical protein [Gemmatimonadales bacterium]
MTDDELNEWTRRHLAEYHRPGETPREPMWQAIARERSARRVAQRPVMGMRRIAAWSLAAVALVALGIGLDRVIPRRDGTPTATTPALASGANAAPSTAQQLATQNVLGQAEVFLTGYRADVTHGRLDQTDPAEARQLLGATRLLLDSRVASDPRLRVLLEDLELTLAQIAQDGRNPKDAKTITQGFEQRGVLTQLRSKVQSGPAAAVSQGVI